MAIVLRSIIKRAGVEVVARHWTGSSEALQAVWRVARLPGSPPEVQGAS